MLTNQLQSKSKLPLLIGADFERGTAMRLDEGTSFPTAMALAAAGNPKDAYTMGKITALEARAVGIQWIYAPDADVNNNPGNPIINTRSFGEDPARVSEFVSEFIRGVQENGGLATAKHFPGHGDTAGDSHIDLPVIKADRERLEHLEFVPFRAAIAAGVGSIMTGHLAVPALEPDANTPATLSSRILTDVLRKELGFEGLVVTDAMDMGGITVRFAPGDAAVRAFLAGADALLMPPVPDAAYDALLAAAQSGQITAGAAGRFGAAHSAGQGKAGIEQQPAGGSGCVECEVWQRCVSSGGAGDFGPRDHFAAGHIAPVAAGRDETDARVAGFALR